MKNLKSIALALVLVISTLATAQNVKIDAAKSKITWVGKAVTHQHTGTVNIKDGQFIFKNNKLKGGNFVVDMTSLTSTDATGESLGKLNGHLKSEDFFGTEKYPTSKLVFKKIVDKKNGSYTITADLTIKDTTNPVTFDITFKGKTASTTFKIDRTKYGIKYGSGSFFDNLGDKTIENDFTLTVNLEY